MKANGSKQGELGLGSRSSATKGSNARGAAPKKLDESKSQSEDIAATYNAFKEFEGRRYTGMKIGRSHKWNYDPGVWVEKKVTPDQWEIQYSVTKRRAGKAPEGSGVPVGTGYHWYILAHQNVTKLDANAYTTSLTGMKFKLSHRRADKGTWSASVQAQRRHLIKILEQVISDLQRDAEADKKKPIEVKAAPRATARKALKPIAAPGKRSTTKRATTSRSRSTRRASTA